LNWAGATCAQVDPELWYPEKGGSSRLALAMCRRCPIRAACLGDALQAGTHDGIWGGIPPRPRRLILQAFRKQRPGDVEAFAERAIMQFELGEEEGSCAA
jgi:WhiB family redox-sensing transcriptional regulator